VKVIVEQCHSEDSPMAATSDSLEKPPPMAAIDVIEHDGPSFKSSLCHMMDAIDNVNAVGTRHSELLRSFWGILGSGVQISKLAD